MVLYSILFGGCFSAEHCSVGVTYFWCYSCGLNCLEHVQSYTRAHFIFGKYINDLEEGVTGSMY